MTIKVFGRSGCARTREVILRVRRWMKDASRLEVRMKFYDLETAEGLAEAAFQQLDGEIPAVLVDAEIPGQVISGESSFRDRVPSFPGENAGGFWPSPGLN